MGIDVESVMRGSRRALLRRRLIGGGGALASIVVIVAAVVLVVSMVSAGGDDVGPGDHSKDKSRLDPNSTYTWENEDNGKANKVTTAYSRALWAYLTEHFPGVKAFVQNESGHMVPVASRQAEHVFLMRTTENLYKGVDDTELMEHPDKYKPIATRTVLDMFENYGKGGDAHWSTCCGTLVKFPGAKHKNGFEIQVMPRGSYTKRTHDALDLASCNGSSIGQERTTCHAEDATGPHGEDVQNITKTAKDDVDGTLHTFAYSTVMYRKDGSAVLISLSSDTDPGANAERALSFKDMIGVASALPKGDITS
ncbi:MAG TPA: hypothetical protein VE172_17690 [Stackebrandtia sp.]|uniref:hypothetical protein n=1 Tax=Stackebrandtia sp. TaxID=2023065 RepID=UPI002D2A09F6|nr:hypothetical protein [Stackebrandtia sp.]HZE40639.1 hypothetical protein [Stackebrandtia sp.]